MMRIKNKLKFCFLWLVLWLPGYAVHADWSWVNPAPQGNILNDIEYVEPLSRYVAIGGVGTLLKSEDGADWSKAETNVKKNLHALTYNENKIIVVGQNGVLLSSNDGEVWAMVDSGTTEDLLDATWTGSYFLAIGKAGVVLKSANGEVWESINSGTQADLLSLAWNGQVTLAVGTNGTVATSMDGDEWFSQTLLPNGVLSVAAGQDIFVAATEQRIYWSNDGLTWELGRDDYFPIHQIKWLTDRFVAVGDMVGQGLPDAYTS